ncbi:MAG: methylmalonyl-CoA mutase small subunit [Phycisphaerales bacterium]|nr:MAG: methylmalonyl-CoA mutase small subunit [Phycisphaerales bacterium]
MLEPELKILDDFPPVSYESWRAIVEKDLRGTSFDDTLVTETYEGIGIQPLYTAGDQQGGGDQSGFPGAPPHTRGGRLLGNTTAGWEICQEHAEPDPAALNNAILDDLNNGVTSIHLRLDSMQRPGAIIQAVSDFESAFAAVDLDGLCISLDAGPNFFPAAACLAAFWKSRSEDPATVRGAFNADPLHVLAGAGRLPLPLDEAMNRMVDLAAWTSKNLPGVTAVGVDTGPYHLAGASAAQDLAVSMATGIEYLRTMERGGLSVAAAAGQIRFTYRLGCRLFLAIAKLRAARRLWARIIEASGGDDAPLNMHVRTADRVLTRRDPWVNLLRNTVACFAGAVGGAETITLAPFDSALGPPDELSMRIARNTQLLLREESHLHRVIDPAGGSWFVEKLTDELAETAWAILQEIESRGGATAALLSGRLGEQIQPTWQARRKNLATRSDAVTGVSEFPNLNEEAITREPVDLDSLRSAAAERIDRRAITVATTEALAHLSSVAKADESARSGGDLTAAAVEAAAAGASTAEITAASIVKRGEVSIPPLTPHPLAGPFELLRDASDQWLAQHGRRPSVFLANLGPVAHHTARTTYTRNLFEAGGLEALTNDDFPDADSAAAAFAGSGSSIAVICSSDKLYQTVVADLAPKLRKAGARTIILAGRPGENEPAYRAAGIDRFIFAGCDVLAILTDLLREEGVLS